MRIASLFPYAWRRRFAALTSPRRRLTFGGERYSNPRRPGRYRQGCNLVGYAFGELGLGQHLRAVAQAFAAAQLPFSVTPYEKTLHRQEDRQLAPYVDPTSPHLVNLLCLNGDAVLDLYTTEPALFRGRYNIGYGYWELSDYPTAWLWSFNVLDEVWAPSRHVHEMISKKASLPVVHQPIAVDFPPLAADRASFELPEEACVFLFTFDFSSKIARKNPIAVVEAFRRAFPEERRDVRLLLKSKRVDSVHEQVAEERSLRAALPEDPRLRLICETWPGEKVRRLIASCDVYVSLHRAEGFGLGMAEAMRLGKAVVATGSSGNLDFTLPDHACLIDSRQVSVAATGGYYGLEEASTWAEPDVDQAAACLRRLADNEELRHRLGQRARHFLEKHHSAAAIGARYADRLRLIGLA